MYFFKHKVRISAFFGGTCIPCRHARLSFDLTKLFIINHCAFTVYHGEFSALHYYIFFGVFQYCGYIGGDEIFILSDACYERTVASRGEYFIRKSVAKYGKRI